MVPAAGVELKADAGRRPPLRRERSFAQAIGTEIGIVWRAYRGGRGEVWYQQLGKKLMLDVLPPAIEKGKKCRTVRMKSLVRSFDVFYELCVALFLDFNKNPCQ
jgi:hypothetical protein